MRVRIAGLLLPVLMLLSAVSSRALLPPTLLSKGKQATALVEIGNAEGFGSAFCIDAAEGLFITNAHVATALGNKGSVLLILHPGEADQRRMRAMVLRADKDLDLALLRVRDPKQLVALPLASIDEAAETLAVTAFGYPLGTELSLAKDEYPNVTISNGHITALRRSRGQLAKLQLEAQLNPGNSGGPVLTEKGRVVGIVVSGIPGTGISFAIPVSHLNRFLSSAAIDLTLPRVDTSTARAVHNFAVHVSAFHRALTGATLALTLSAGPEDHRTVSTTVHDNQTYIFRAAPLPGGEGPQKLRLIVEDSSGKSTLLVPDQKIMLGESPVLLSSLREIDRNDGTQVLFTDKELRATPVSGLEHLETLVQNARVHTDLSHATHITIEDAEGKQPTVSYRIEVKQNGSVIGERHGEFTVAAAPIAPAAAAPSRLLLIADYNSCLIQRFNGLTGQYLGPLAPRNKMENPTQPVFGPDGNLYIGGTSNEIFRYNGQTGQFMDVFVPKDKNGGAYQLTHLVFGPDGNLYASSKWTQEVKRYDGKTGAFLDNFVPKGSGGLNIPGYLQFGPDHNLYVNSTSNDCIKVYDGKTGAYLRDFISGDAIHGLGDFCFRPDKRFYLVCSGSRQIKRFDSETGKWIDDFIKSDALGGDPLGMTFDPSGNLYILTTDKDVKRFNGKTGRFIDVFVSYAKFERQIALLFH